MNRSTRRLGVATVCAAAFVLPATASYALWSVTASGTGTVTTAAPALAAPTVSCRDDGRNPTLTWSAVSGATSYRVYRSTTPLGSPKKTVAAPATSVGLVESDMGPPANSNQKYDVLVKAVSANGESAASNVFTIQFKENGGCAG